LTKLYLSSFCFGLYVIMALVCLLLVVWSFMKGKGWASHWIFTLIELSVNLFIVTDTFLKMRLLGISGFFSSISNTIDFSLMCLIMTLYALYLFVVSADIELYEPLLEEVLYIVWFCWQIKRVHSLVKQANKSRVRGEEFMDLEAVQITQTPIGN
jgi:hypothetical protein